MNGFSTQFVSCGSGSHSKICMPFWKEWVFAEKKIPQNNEPLIASYFLWIKRSEHGRLVRGTMWPHEDCIKPPYSTLKRSPLYTFIFLVHQVFLDGIAIDSLAFQWRETMSGSTQIRWIYWSCFLNFYSLQYFPLTAIIRFGTNLIIIKI